MVFDFTPTRSRNGPLELPGCYEGFVQADADGSYDEFLRVSDTSEVGCNSFPVTV
jgi:hypothetical protein